MRQRYWLRLGLAFTATGHFILGPSLVSALSGGLQVSPKLVAFCGLFGFALGALGIFITTLFTDVRGPESSTPQPPENPITTDQPCNNSPLKSKRPKLPDA